MTGGKLGRTLVVEQLLAGLGGVLGVGGLNDGVDGARLLAETAVNALGHVDIVLGSSARSISSLLSLDSDGLGGADLYLCQRVDHVVVYGLSYSLAKLASNASLFTRGVSSEGVLATESRRDRALGVSVYIFGHR